jgi:hypothetical protein
MSQSIDGPVTVNGTLKVVDSSGHGSEPNVVSFEVAGANSRFANITAFGPITAIGGLISSTLLPPDPGATNTVTVKGGFVVAQGNIIVTGGSLDVRAGPIHSKGASFEGNVEITGDIQFKNAADCAEDFDISNAMDVAPGAVMVVGSNSALEPCRAAYDRRVVGVVSGADGFKPAIILDRQEESGTNVNRKSVALMGKVSCRVDTQYGAIEVGDLLTTSPTVGHAMKAVDPAQAFGSVLGKALSPAREGTPLIAILVTLQ